MTYRNYLLELLLCALVAAHTVYVWRCWRSEPERTPWKRSDAVFMAVLAVLFVGTLIAGAVTIVAGADPAAPTGLGAVSILMGIWLDFKLGRACGK